MYLRLLCFPQNSGKDRTISRIVFYSARKYPSLLFFPSPFPCLQVFSSLCVCVSVSTKLRVDAISTSLRKVSFPVENENTQNTQKTETVTRKTAHHGHKTKFMEFLKPQQPSPYPGPSLHPPLQRPHPYLPPLPLHRPLASCRRPVSYCAPAPR